MKLRPRTIPGVHDVLLNPFEDHRGVLTKLFNGADFQAAGLSFHWQQVLHSQTGPRNTIRGIYVQEAPYTEAKLIYCIRGRLVWTFVDLRRGSPTFGRSDVVELAGGTGRAVLAERGFGHGSLTLEDDTHVLLMADNRHAPEHGHGIVWNDPEMAVDWPLLGPAPAIAGTQAAYGSFAHFRDTVGGV